jgi:hypothetical protein
MTWFNVPHLKFWQVYHVKRGVVKQKIFAALTDAIKEQYQLTDTWTSHKILHLVDYHNGCGSRHCKGQGKLCAADEHRQRI